MLDIDHFKGRHSFRVVQPARHRYRADRWPLSLTFRPCSDRLVIFAKPPQTA
jgi:hypothetical protein